MRRFAAVLIVAVATLSLPAAAAADCPGHPDALGTFRVLAVSAATTPRVGRKHFPETLPLADKELVLTFDDGPWPTTTPRVLDALKAECVRATFFLLGRNTDAHPLLARRALAEGHSIGHHTYSHPLLSHLPLAKAEAEINRGIARDEFALTGVARSTPSTPFFRFPGFASSQPLLDRLQDRGIVVFGADVWASDWEPMSPDVQLQKLMQRIEHVGRGIVLLHDTKAQTAAMLPRLLRELKLRGYRIVHVVPASASVTN
ncbi:polysaccharide deacetylase family protein [Undibacter mobilis]|uniref:Chitooligosaccharide deacetylase n=1 Tax=Undibacter mobilis TaxID=2292256 RepID=A0A371BD26_9BRAD|nr:polysaccharide deacetylase family protein [Undibacter mobilis]RDV05474.1 polysaccharide deacetylase family protein [Undibacter mobilis]